MRIASYVISASIALVAAPPAAVGDTVTPEIRVQRDGQHDFEFESGTWITHVRRLQRPLSGSSTWVEYEGTTTVTPLLDGRFEGGVGRFEGHDRLGDRAIRVRFEIRESQPGIWLFEQAFSADGGRTWEVNWIAEDRRGV